MAFSIFAMDNGAAALLERCRSLRLGLLMRSADATRPNFDGKKGEEEDGEELAAIVVDSQACARCKQRASSSARRVALPFGEDQN